MTQIVTTPPTQVATCALRIARLAADGTTPAGALNGYCTKQFATLTIAAEKETGQDLAIRNACGDLITNYKERDIVKRYNFTLTTPAYDPEFESMLLGTTSLTKQLGTTRTVADGATTSGSPTVTSATAAFSQYDVGGTITGTGIPALATIIAVNSATSVTISANATATGSSVSITITPAAMTVGALGVPLGQLPSDLGVSLEFWSKNVQGGIVDPYLPYLKFAVPASFWSVGDGPDQQNGAQTTQYVGYGVENANWGNGPWNDWMIVRAGDSAQTLTSGRAMSKHYTQLIPTAQTGYIAVPTQV